jgi:hypothetical protein
MPTSVVPRLSIDCINCGNKMVLMAVERRLEQTICTYECRNKHLQQLAIPKVDVPRNAASGPSQAAKLSPRGL